MQTPAADLLEVRLYGLNKTITTEALGEFLGKGVRIRGVLLHPQTQGSFQWAQVWVATEGEIASLLSLRDALSVNGITISRVGMGTSLTPPHTSWDLISQLNKPRVAPSGFGLSAVHNSIFGRQENNAALPRNLYILNLPLDLTQVEFKNLFTPYGMVEHSILLSQLDGIGRRRGFVLMASHGEAMEAMHQMHGKWIDGSKLDVSWALVQREAKNMVDGSLPNRVVHPPAVSTRRESTPEASVIVENLDPFLFPDIDSVSSIFRSFGTINRVVKLSDTSVLIQFELADSAGALLRADGLLLGNRKLKTSSLAPTTMSFDPFGGETPTPWLEPAFTRSQHLANASAQLQTHLAAVGRPYTPFTSTTRLNAESQPFIPGSAPTSLPDTSSLDFLAPNYKPPSSTNTPYDSATQSMTSSLASLHSATSEKAAMQSLTLDKGSEIKA